MPFVCRAVIFALAMAVSSPMQAQTQSSAGQTGIPPAPVGHRQPTADVVPPGDSASAATDNTGSPAQITPQEERDNKISSSLCKTPTC